MLNEEVGKNLRKMRLLNNYSQEKVEIELGISHRTYSNIENGKGRVDMDRLEAFANFYKIDPVAILTMKDGLNQETHEPQTEYRKTDVELAKIQEKLSGLKKENSFLKTQIKTFEATIKDKDLIISLLKEKK